MDRRKLSTVYYENFEKEPIVKLKRRATGIGLETITSSTNQTDVSMPSKDLGSDSNSVPISIEEKLIEAGSWALFCIRLPGYFPIATTSTKEGRLQLQLSCCSLPTLYTTIVTILSLLGSIHFYFTFTVKFVIKPASMNEKIDPEYNCTAEPPPEDPPYGNVISFIWASLILLVTYTTYLRCSRIFYISGSLKFWKKSVTLFENLIKFGYNLNDSYFIEISHRLKIHVFKLFTFGTCIMCYQIATVTPLLVNFHCMIFIDYFTCILDLFTAFILCSHIGYSVWLTYWIKLYILAFQTMHDDLDEIQESSPEENTTGNGYYGIQDKDSNPPEIPESTFHDTAIETKIRRTLSTFLLIEEHMHEFNSFFGVTIIFETLFTVTLLIVNVYCAFTYFDGTGDKVYAIFGVCFPCIIYALAFLEFNSESSILSGKSTATLKKMDVFFIPSSNKAELQSLQIKVLALIARVADNPPMISAGNFFSINRHLLTSILGTVTTYLIVLLQFRGSPPESKPTNTTGENH